MSHNYETIEQKTLKLQKEISLVVLDNLLSKFPLKT